MPKTNNKVYPIEEALEKLIDEVRLSIRKTVGFFFTIPKRKDDKMIYAIETIAWLLLTIAIVLRAFN